MRRPKPAPLPTPLERKLAVALSGLSPTARYLIGVSGGRDSVALLHALVEAGFRRLIVCHLNHGLRGRAASADARFVAALAARLGLEFESEKADVLKLAAEERDSIEVAARNARHRFFARVARRRRCRKVFLAHHADDQAETFLINLFRGAGRGGLGGMSPDCERVVDEGPGVRLRLLRPMLGVRRAEIADYIAARRLHYREDASNLSPAHTRNRIRHELLPLAEAIFGRDVRAALWRTAEILRAEEEWLSALAKEESGVSGEEQSHLSVPELHSQPVARQRRLILEWLRRQGVPEIGFDEVELVRSLLQGARAKVNLPGNWHARRRQKRLFLESGA